MTPAIAGLTVAAICLGVLLGYVGTIYWFRFDRARMAADWNEIAHLHQQHADRLKLEDTRLGINLGIEYAVSAMRETLDGLDEHAEEHSP